MRFDFGPYSSLLLLGFLQGMIFAGLFWWRSRREERLSDRFMAFFLLLCCLHIAQYMLGFAGWYDAHDWHSTFMFYFPFHHYLWFGPVLYFYFRSLTNQSFRLEPRQVWHFVPGMVYAGVFVICALLDLVIWQGIEGRELPFFYQTKGLLGVFLQSDAWRLPDLLGLVSFYLYLMMAVRLYNRYKRYIADHFSATEDIRFAWLRNVLYTLICGLTVVWLFILLDRFLDMSYVQYWFSHFAVALMIYPVSIAAYVNTHRLSPGLSFRPEMPEENPADILADPVPELNQWKTRLLEHMQEERPYLHPELTLNQLAQQLQLSPSVLSRTINQGLGQNFNDFINAYRVREMERRLSAGDQEQYTLMSLAFESGFNSKATFNRAFRKFTGTAPSDYRPPNGEKSS